MPAVRVDARRVRVRLSDLDRFLAAGATSAPERGSDDDPAGAIQAMQSTARDQFLAALTEMLRTGAASEDEREMASALRELAAAAEALADTFERGRDGS